MCFSFAATYLPVISKDMAREEVALTNNYILQTRVQLPMVDIELTICDIFAFRQMNAMCFSFAATYLPVISKDMAREEVALTNNYILLTRVQLPMVDIVISTSDIFAFRQMNGSCCCFLCSKVSSRDI